MASTSRPPAGVPLSPLLLLGAFTVYTHSLTIFARPFVARGFGIDDATVSFIEGIAAIGTLGTFWITRRADRHGRRGAILGATLGSALAALAALLSPALLLFLIALTVLRACTTALGMVVSVTVSEEAPELSRARRQSVFGLASSLGGAVAAVLAAFVEDLPGTWRWMFGVAAAVGLAVPWLAHAIPETARFTRARERGTTDHSATRDLFQPPYRRPAVGLLVAATLRPVGIVALGSWAFFHAVENLAIPPGTVSLIYAGAALSVLGNPFGAWMSDRFGRRPTLVANVILLLAAGIAYYWIPAGPSGPGAWILGACFATFAFASQAFSVANRLLDSECFPTHLRATYTGANAVAEAVGTVVSYLALYGLLLWTDHLPLAVTLLAATSTLASIPVFLATAPETRGLTLDEASGDTEDDDPPLGSAAAG